MYRTFQEQVEHLTCRTEKDSHIRLNHRTAGYNNSDYCETLYYSLCIIYTGVLAGMWPCGIVTFIRELFIAESKSQVYGHLHQFLRSNAGTASNLSKISSNVYTILYVVYYTCITVQIKCLCDSMLSRVYLL